MYAEALRVYVLRIKAGSAVDNTFTDVRGTASALVNHVNRSRF
jgi:hypothetical protein